MNASSKSEPKPQPAAAAPVPHSATLAQILGPPANPAPANPVPARWQWHLKTLLSLRDRLAGDHEALRRSSAEPLEPHSMSEADSATDEFDHTLALGQLSAEQDALHELDAAIQRLHAGVYGVCEESGRPIPTDRLRAIPWTRFTREVEERLERSGIIRRPRLTEARTIRGDGRPWRAPGRPGSRRGRPA